MKTTRFFLFAMLFLLIASCAKMESIDFSRQKVLFQNEYLNYAWGKSHYGWYIDSVGAVYAYQLPENWNFADSNHVISRTSIDQNLSKTRFVFKIDAAELAAKKKLMANAAKGALVKSDIYMADAGIRSKYELIYHPESKTYKQVLLDQWGDISIKNISSEAALLSQWMDSVSAKVYPTHVGMP